MWWLPRTGYTWRRSCCSTEVCVPSEWLNATSSPSFGRPRAGSMRQVRQEAGSILLRMWRIPGRIMVIGVACLTACLCSFAGTSSAAASQTEQRVATTWPSRFCSSVSRVMGPEATQLIERARNRPTGVGTEAAITRLGRDIEASLTSAPTAQLRRELTQYHQSIGTGRGTGQVLTAVSHFDLRASTQLRNCGIRPVKG
jgi:hypothetical protein